MFKQLNFKQDTAGSTWSIVHGFGKPVAVDVILASGQKAYPSTFTQSSDFNTVTLTWSTPQSGGARVVTTNTVPVDFLTNTSWTPDQIGANPDYVSQNLGMFDAAGSSSAPPTANRMAANRTFNATPGVFAVTDNFNGTEPIVGHIPDVWTPTANYPTTAPAWAGNGTLTSNVAGGNLIVKNSEFPFIDDADEFDMQNGIFIECKFDAPTADSTLVLGFNLGYTSISIVANGTDGTHTGAARIDASGFNGAVDANGNLLPENTQDHNDFGLTSASFSIDRYYTDDNQDFRNKVLRAELTADRLTLYVDGVIMISQPTRWEINLFASSSYQYSGADANVSLFSSGPSDDITVAYIKVGSL